MNRVITISRQYASGGREIGKIIAQHYGIPFYDNDLIALAAKESGFTENIFEKQEDKASNSLIYSIAMGLNVFGTHGYSKEVLSIDDKVFLAQSDIIRKVANEGP
ncbi:MAG: cytidylate kinase-like family protein, partial [Lachnospiraceae bacterium]|nr:cytidylate kinase-like family protein [Lachnospiraceae bacterium]